MYEPRTLRKDLARLEEMYGPVLLFRCDADDCIEDRWPDAPVPVCSPSDIPNQMLDQEYDAGYGGTEIPPCYAWTHTHVCFISQYDGSTYWSGVPRNPTNDGRVEMPGG